MQTITPKFKVGDKVKHTLGTGPIMTVERLEGFFTIGSAPRPFNGKVTCSWPYNSRIIKRETFHQDNLKRA
jgi:uncharacterized protein YodC (DUF2158 family)